MQKFNVLSAGKYGELKLLLPEGQITLSTGPTINRLRHKLQKFTDMDYLLLIGDPLAIGLAVAIASNANHGRLKLLKWDRQEKQYYPLTVSLYGGDND